MLRNFDNKISIFVIIYSLPLKFIYKLVANSCYAGNVFICELD